MSLYRTGVLDILTTLHIKGSMNTSAICRYMKRNTSDKQVRNLLDEMERCNLVEMTPLGSYNQHIWTITVKGTSFLFYAMMTEGEE